MKYCAKCGAQVEENVKFCPQCGAEMESFQQYNYQEYTYAQNTAYNQEEYFNPQEVKQNKAMGVLAYLGILVLVPILSGDKTSKYIAHHVNQGLILYVIGSIIGLINGTWLYEIAFLPYVAASIITWALNVVAFACFILQIMGIVSACKGTRKKLPLIGEINLIKR